MIVYPQLTNPSFNLAALPNNDFPIRESFATVTNKCMFGRPKFNRSVVKTFSTNSPGGDGKVLFVTDATNHGTGTTDSGRWAVSASLATGGIAFFQDAQLSKAALLMLINIIMLILGCFLEGLAIMVMAVPVLMPLLRQAGIDPLHFGVMFVLNIMIGTITPPVGTIMYVVCALGKISIVQFAREAWPLIVTLVICLLIVTYVPVLSTWLPDLMMPVR